MTLAASCHLRWHQIENHVDLQSTTDNSVCPGLGLCPFPSDAEVQFSLQPTCGWWVNWLVLLALSYYSPHWHLWNCGFNLPSNVQCLSYPRITTSMMDGPYPVGVALACWYSTHMVWGPAVFLIKSSHCCGTFVRPSAWLCSGLTKVMSTNNSLTKPVSILSHRLISILLATLMHTLAFPHKCIHNPFVHTSRVSEEVQYRCFSHQCHVNIFQYSV